MAGYVPTYTKVRELKRRKNSSTPGSSKGPNCKKSPLKIRGAKDARFYKTDPEGFRNYGLEILKLQTHINSLN
jgi:hypothetical protein